jgi:drug/metabolite transporter (DMT)-like permease
VAAACATTGYSLIDSEALRLLRQSAAPGFGAPAVTAVYALLEGLVTSAWLSLWVLALPAERRALRMGWRPLGRAAITGAGIYLAYTLVLVSMGFVTNVSYVVAFRQLSIPLGAIWGMTLLGEPRPLPRLAGIAVIFGGLVLVGIG